MTKWKEQQQMQNNEQNRQIMLKLEMNKWQLLNSPINLIISWFIKFLAMLINSD